MARARHPRPHGCLSVLTLFVRFVLGIVIVLFFQCMIALFNPVYRRGEGIKWGLVPYTMVMFLVATVGTAAALDVESLSYINNSEFPGTEGVAPPGPFGYQVYLKTLNVVSDLMFNLNNWLADGLLVSSRFVVFTPPSC